MSAPIDDLLYDDSGDEEMDVPSAVPMPSTLGSAVPLAAPSSAIAFPLPTAASAGAGAGAGAGTVAAATTTTSTPGASVAPPVTSASAPMRQPVPAATGLLGVATTNAVPSLASTTTTGSVAAAATAATAKAMPIKQTPPGSGQQMFKQMFALLRQMLPAEQYATLHSELGNGNGNDIKSIVDIIKRIAGDAIFSSVIQKMDLTRTFPTTPPPAAMAMATPSSSSVAPPATIGATGIRPTVANAALGVKSSVVSPSAAASLKQESLVATTTTPVVPPSGSAMSTPATTPQAATNATNGGESSKKQEAMEKIEFAKKLLFHASTCVLPPGTCQVKKCDDVRRVFKHSASCGGNKACQHCEQLKGLVKYHAKECLIAPADHCAIPFCDGLRRAYLNAAAAAAAKSKAAAATLAASTTEPNTASNTTEDEDKNKRVLKTNTSSLDASRKVATTAAAATTATMPGSTPATTPASSAVTSTPATAANGQAAKPKPGVNANVAAEYGHLLQLILHVQKCTSTTCPVGEECAEAKSLLRQINSPNAPARAKTYKQVYAHYKVCLQKNNTANCAMCKIGLRPIVPGGNLTSTSTPTANIPAATASFSTAAAATTTAVPAASTTASTTGIATSTATIATTASTASTEPPPTTATAKRPAICHPSPTKKARTNSTSRTKSPGGLNETCKDPNSFSANTTTDHPSGELLQASVGDIRKEADVLTHTSIELGVERRNMMEGVLKRKIPEQLTCVKEKWAEVDLFNTLALRRQMEQIGQRNGVSMGVHTTEIMAFALQEYLKQAIEEMVEIAKQRGDLYAHQHPDLRPTTSTNSITSGNVGDTTELLATDILRVSCEDSFGKTRTEDLTLRARLLEDALKEETAEKERAKKRKKADRSKVQQDEKLEKELDIEELALKDLKERLLVEEHAGVARIDGRLNESIHGRFARRADSQVTMEDASFWLQSQKPYVKPQLFVRAEIARLLTNAYQ